MQSHYIAFTGQRFSSATSIYISAVEEQLVHLQQFKEWAGPTISKQAGELAGLRQEVARLRRIADDPDRPSTSKVTYAHSLDSPITPSTRHMRVATTDLQTPTTGSQSASHPPHGSMYDTSLSRVLAVPRLHSNIDNEDPTATEHPSKGRLCYTPRDPNSFNLTFTETETQ